MSISTAAALCILILHPHPAPPALHFRSKDFPNFSDTGDPKSYKESRGGQTGQTQIRTSISSEGRLFIETLGKKSNNFYFFFLCLFSPSLSRIFTKFNTSIFGQILSLFSPSPALAFFFLLLLDPYMIN